MSTQPAPLANTEKHLVRIFVIGIFVFLLVFEAIFLGSRMYLENNMQRDLFQANSNKTLQSLIQGTALPDTASTRGKDEQRGPIGVGFLVLDSSGTIVRNRLAGQDTKNLQEILEDTVLASMPNNEIIHHNALLLRKIALNNNEGYILFMAQTGYDENGLLRDILRFLLMDGLILIPFFFMARIYVRETLEPVRENLDTMNHFVHDAGHELKTPLAIISGNLQLLRDSKNLDRELIHGSLDTIDGMNNSLQGLLELADLKLPEKNNKISLKKVFDNEIAKLQPDYLDISIENTLSPKDTVTASEKHLSILARNLIENALKYNQKGGSVSVGFEKNTLTVNDTGIGIAPEDQARIFDRFYRAHAGSGKTGSGIGLTLVDRIAKLYGWTLTVKSNPGEGTSIYVKF